MTEVPAEWRAETTPEELKARRERWAADLESGLYEQGKQCLKTVTPDVPDKFCCLGVACERYRQETGLGVWRHDEFSNNIVFDPGDGNGEERWSALPYPVAQWYGVNVDPQVGPERGIRQPLSYHNDENGASFEDIAKMIRRDL